MTIIVKRDGVRGAIAEEIARLESLIADLRRLRRLDLPTAEQPEGAPIIDDYELGARLDRCLTGMVWGHPRLGNRPAVTTGLWAWAPELGWARTLSRYYRLGRPGNAGRPS